MALIAAPFLISFAKWLPLHPHAIILTLSELLSALLIVIRRPGQIPMSAYAILIGFLGSGLPLLARPGDVALIPEQAALGLSAVGGIIAIWAKLALRRSFGAIAANRGVKRGGPYRFVRHPMYLGYILIQIGFLLGYFSFPLLGLYVVVWAIQILRIREEEKVLLQDAAYREFANDVPRRLVPGY
ncbi:isoprenylcysteine carboxylmethyltransferase family protein [Novosphingobium sp. G106]|uniref:methyltransferase family protein n=1 Tax=Novosphingobium sp. G106 TaxID=2849500 RepID=UPI001C2DBD4B|nr:isoprenylcysteine carboxylmethyltransferase family protein [Novosphingobium sp. G106]MBV1689350.1 isoprenylcysteine carboxylmethyltransferase family protein [Novosphingobium sp. G106]